MHTDTPEQPQNVTGEALNSTAILLTWIEPHDNNAPISNYSISYTEPDFLNGTAVMVVVEVEMVVVTGLHPGVSYAFTVTANNDIGSSRLSIPAIITTEEEGMSLSMTVASINDLGCNAESVTSLFFSL